MLKRHQVFNICYLFIGIANLYAVYTDLFFLQLVAMPLIGSSLVIYFLIKSKIRGSFNLKILLGLLLAMGGDVQLLFSNGRGYLFMSALISTQLGYLLYLGAFVEDLRFKSMQRNQFGVASAFIFISLAASYFLFAKEYLGEYEQAALLHLFVLALLPILASFRIKRNSYSFGALFTASACFVISDYAIGYSTFIKYNRALVLVYLTFYLLAQYLLVMGSIDRDAQESSKLIY